MIDPKGAYTSLLRTLGRARASWTAHFLSRGALRWTAVALAAYTAAVLLGMLGARLSGLSWGLSIGVALVLLAAFGLFVIRPMLRRPGLEKTATLLDERHAGPRNLIVNAYQLGRNGSSESLGYATDLIEELVREADEAARSIPSGGWEPKGATRRYARLLVAALAVSAGAYLLAPGRYRAAATSLLDPGTSGSVAPLILVHPGNGEVERGRDFEVLATVIGSRERPILHRKRRGSRWEAAPMDSADGGGFRSVLRAVEVATDYRVAVGKTTTDLWHVEVNEAPRVTGFRMALRYPAYAGMKDETIVSGNGDIAALRGTRVELTVEANRPVASATLEIVGGRRVRLAPDAETRSYRGSLTLTEPARYTVRLADPLRKVDRSTPEFSLTPLADRAPLLNVLYPGRDVDLPESMKIPLEVECIDDYGLTDLTLVSRVGRKSEVRTPLRRFERGTREARVGEVWDLSSLDLAPGDVITYCVEVRDNDGVLGAKATRSAYFTVRFPSMEEIYAEMDDAHESTLSDLSKMLEEQEQFREKVHQMVQELSRKPEVSWEQKKEIQQALDRQAEIRDRLSRVAEELQAGVERAERKNLISSEVAEKMAEVQKLLSEIQSTALKEAMQRLAESMSSLDRDKLAEAMKKFELTQEALAKGLDRTIEMLRRIREEEKLDAAARMAEELARKQGEVNEQIPGEKPKDPKGGEETDAAPKDSAKDSKDSGKDPKEGGSEPEDAKEPTSPEDRAKMEDLAEKEAGISKTAEELRKQIEELSKELARREKEAAESLEEAASEPKQSELRKSLEETEQSLREKEAERARQFGFRAKKELENMAKSLSAAKQKMSNAQREALLKEVQKIVLDLVDISKAQEALLEASPTATENELAEKEQSLLESAGLVAENVSELAKKTMSIGVPQGKAVSDAMRKMETAMRSFERGNRTLGLSQSKESSGALNDAILTMMESHQSMCQNPSSGSSAEMMQKMEGLSGEQQDVNESTSDLMGQQGQSERLSENPSERLSRLAAQQEQIRQGMQEVAESLAGRNDVLGDLSDIAKEMERVANDMRERKLDDRLIRRQQQILSRMLDAQKSVRRQDELPEREARTGVDVKRPSPAEIPGRLLEGRDRMKADILRGQGDAYPPEYRKLVEEYFRALSGVPRASGDPAPAGSP